MPDPFEKLTVWNLSHDLVVEIYRITASFPAAEKYGLVQQVRRAATSIPANIVEGNARSHRREYIQFCVIARSSIAEVKYFLRLSADLKLLTLEQYRPLYQRYDQLGRMMQAFINGLQGKKHTVSAP